MRFGSASLSGADRTEVADWAPTVGDWWLFALTCGIPTAALARLQASRASPFYQANTVWRRRHMMRSLFDTLGSTPAATSETPETPPMGPCRRRLPSQRTR